MGRAAFADQTCGMEQNGSEFLSGTEPRVHSVLRHPNLLSMVGTESTDKKNRTEQKGIFEWNGTMGLTQFCSCLARA